MNALTIQGQSIRRDGDLWCITDLWRASGSPKAKRPVDYSRTNEALEAKDYESGWDVELKIELARLRRIRGWAPKEDKPGPEPRGLSFAYGRTWRVILGDEIYDELKRRNPEPKDGSLHGQWILSERMKLIRREDMIVTLYIARRSTRWTDYERDMREHFRRSPIQLRLVRA